MLIGSGSGFLITAGNPIGRQQAGRWLSSTQHGENICSLLSLGTVELRFRTGLFRVGAEDLVHRTRTEVTRPNPEPAPRSVVLAHHWLPLRVKSLLPSAVNRGLPSQHPVSAHLRSEKALRIP